MRVLPVIFLILSTGCATVALVGQDPGEPSHVAPLGIPPGHVPPPGECRIWLPGHPPGHQPPPGPCHELEAQVPPGAWLLYRPPQEPEYVRVAEYDEHRAGVVLIFRYYDARTGVYVRMSRP